MASLDKEIEVLMLRGEKGYSSYEEAVANALFSGTLEEWIETFATPDNYITRYEIKFVTQAQYEALVEADQLRPNCYYFITDDDTWDTIQDIISRVGILESSMETATSDISNLQEDVGGLQTNGSGLNDDVEALQEAVNGLSPVATSGDYNDLINKPSGVSKVTGTITFAINSSALGSLITSHKDIKFWIETSSYGNSYFYPVIVNRVFTLDTETFTLYGFYINNSGVITSIAENTSLKYMYIE